MEKLSSGRVSVALTLIIVVMPLLVLSSGCGRKGGVVGETDEYSYEDVAAQIRAEDEASEAERELRDR
ncbi:hypothetical protein [Aporhodopirellula aestuarii]|uniref:Secreted protein n=1 Tax=Aporhodopirellula aestuarii TaxID=2950107 RepID=A0ABT0U6Q1_9BACT|nr:hypothetical protein [Aporhodopirellula aestuarii]MCM2372573.1 hypothetical protein [Aporhodopirellula aestuarii]